MSTSLLHNKLKVHYSVLQPGKTATVWVTSPTAGGIVSERWPAWLPLSRIQWFPAWLEGVQQLDWALVQELSTAVTPWRSRWRWIASPCSGRGWRCRTVEFALFQRRRP